MNRFRYSVHWDHTHWRERAEEARAIAEGLDDPECVRIMLRIAEGYDQVADRAQIAERAACLKPRQATAYLAG